MRPSVKPAGTTLLSILLVLNSSGEIDAAEPLHVRIDRLIEAKAGGSVAAPAGNAEFARRVYLDFAGRIPTIEETREFLADKSPDKRGKLTGRLVNGAEYPRRMEELFNVILMERRGDNPEWRSFLRQSFEANKPWDRLVAEILNPNADDKTTRGSAFFITRRLTKVGQQPTDYPGLTRDIGRLFLGMDLQCCQCHDHVHVADYKQPMFQGLFAFVQNGYIRRDVKFPAVGEKPLTKKLDFMSVFIKEPKMIGPKVPGDGEILIPVFKRGNEYKQKPDRRKRTPGVLKFSPLKKLAERLPRADNRQFARNIVNRLWFALMGRGLVHPLDLHHSGNPPSHPKLLDLLAGDFVAHKFDIRYLLRELALTKTYQRSGLLPADGARVPEQSYRVFNERALSAEQILRSALVALGSGRAKPQAVDGRFRKLEKAFVAAFANAPKNPEETFSPSVKSALFLRNSTVVLSLLKPQPGNLVDRLSRESKTARLADELYLAVLSRRPTAEETQFVTTHLAGSKDRAKAVGQLAWALLASTEFCLNH
jgi:Protein of unknown function (DUF1549)/Protein of unknown function (DUF1553)